MKRIYCVTISVILFTGGSFSQRFTDQGLLSGSGMTVIPTTTIIPVSELRLQGSRIDYVNSGRSGQNIISMGAGFSSSLEMYMKVSSEQVGLPQSQLTYGFGGKFRYPGLLPVVRRLALWMESSSADHSYGSALFPSDAFRTALLATVDSNGIHPTFLAGISRIQEQNQPMYGVGVTVAAGNHAQIGIEVIRGYLAQNSTQAALSASLRLLPNISLHVSPGYLSTSRGSTWTFSFGISCTTSDIDFHPRYEEQQKDEFLLPSIEELEKENLPSPPVEGSNQNGSGSKKLSVDSSGDSGITHAFALNKSVGEQLSTMELRIEDKKDE